ncbi:MAG: amidohydrolase family protein [Proteobacteria bacterium]|nr:amidohydrolase family protein [Pseudomonadota bacterium]
MRSLALTLSFLIPSVACAKKGEVEGWDIEADYKTSDTFSAELQTGTWMNVDLSPDGTTLVFDLLGDLYTMPVEGGTATPLSTGLAWDQDPRYSPDGTRLLYISDRDGNQEIWIRDLETGEASVFHATARPHRFGEATWSPDGKHLLVRKRKVDTRSIGMCELWLFDVDGGAGVQLTETKSSPFPVGGQFAPDGKSIYYAATPWRFDYNRDPNNPIYDLHQMDLETGEVTRLTAEAGGAFSPLVHPRNGEIVVLRRKATDTILERFDPWDGGRERVGDLVLEHDNMEGFALNGLYPHMALTPDGHDVILWDDGTLKRVVLATGEETVIPWMASVEVDLAPHHRATHRVGVGEDVNARLIRWPRVSPDGTQVVFEALGRLWLQPVEGGAATAITDGSSRPVGPTWHPNSKAVAYATWHDDHQGAVWVQDLESGDAERLTERPAQYLAPSFSPDGEKLAWIRGSGAPMRGHDTNRELWWRLEVADGREIRDVMAWGDSNRSDIAWSPDGERFLLQEDESQDTPHTHAKTVLVSYDDNGQDRRVLARWDRGMEVEVSPDGSQLAFVEWHEVFTAPLPLAGGKALELGPEGGSVPTTRVGETAGSWLDWSSGELSWLLGDALTIGDDTLALAASMPRAHGTALTAYTNARIHTMGDAGSIDGTLLVDGERIVGVGDVEIPADAQVVDLAGKTVIPGLIDVHAHLHYGSSDAHPLRSWRHEANLAYGVTTVHDPSANDDIVFATAERIEAGVEKGPRTYSTGYILYGAWAKYRTRVEDEDEARMHLQRKAATGAVSVKSYQQSARDQRQWVMQAAREEGLNVYPEGGGDLFYNLNMVIDGHTGIEHALPQAPLYDDVIGLYAATGAGYTPTLLVAYGGTSGERYYYQSEELLSDGKFLTWTPEEWVDRNARRLTFNVRDNDWYHLEVSKAAGDLADAGVPVLLGAHGQVQGLGPHWELWALADGMGNEAALRAATISAAWYLGMDQDLGSLEDGKLADFLVLEGDPIEDIRNSVRLDEVVVGGTRYDAEDLEVIP